MNIELRHRSVSNQNGNEPSNSSSKTISSVSSYTKQEVIESTCDSDIPQNSLIRFLNSSCWSPIASKLQGQKLQRIRYFVLLVVSNITLEPAEFLWSLGGNMGIACWSQIQVDKACHDRGYNESICKDVNYYEEIYKEVSKDVIS